MNKYPYMKKIVIVVSFIALFLIGAIYTNRFFNSEIIHQQEAKLNQEIDLYLAIFAEPVDLIKFVDSQKNKKEGERLTLMDDQGVIIYDSSHLQEAVGERDDRPEIKKILNEGKEVSTSLRKSETVGEKLLYVAKPIYRDGERIGLIRLAENYQGFSLGIRQFQLILTLAFFALVAGLVYLLFYFIKQSEEPLRFILPALRELKDHPDKKQELALASPEWNELYTEVNQMMRETNQLYYQQLFSEEKLQFILGNLTLGVFILNHELEVISVNPVIEELFPRKSQNRAFREWFAEPHLVKLLETIEAEGLELQDEFTTAEGKTLQIVLRILQPDQAGDKEYVGIVYDLTAMRKMETMHQDFISNISHELKTPTTSIIGFSETLLDGALENPTTSREFVEIIQREAERLASLIQNILLLLRTETSYPEFDLVSVSPLSVVEEEINRYQEQIEKKKLKVTFALGMPKSTLVPADYFQPIVKNLLENAIAYSEENGQIHLSLRKYQDQLSFSVSDTGIGIAIEEQQRIFERFYRVSKSRQRNSGGSGLGLAIVNHYVQLLGGKIELDSRIGIGTKLTVTWSERVIQHKIGGN